ncbi:MAG TPA: transglutaminaseTgpA domain-containing protein, partial [Thermodesulfovibrionales bacterium]|nr:transglutaminaseTgpA domain-containing protein [Thermodesulfovibrionales bacterium]
PLLHFLNKGDKAKTGFADNVALGRVSEIQEDPNIIFRAHMERVDGDSLYWRGVVFNHFDGKEWRASGDKIPDRPRLSAARGKRIIQTIYLEPYENRYLFAADKPAVVSMRNVVARTDLTFSLPENVGRRIQYEAVSVLSGTIPAGIPDRSVYLQLPAHLPQGMTDLVRELSLPKDPPEIIRTLSAFFAKGNYTYSLRGLPVTTDPLGDFLFKYRYGNCEYFASALAVMLRVAGVPSRVVGGYRGGYYNAIGNYYAVPQKNAHVWVEAYLEGAGWIRLDPTPASADRFGADGRDICLRMQLLFDSLNYYWNAAVIGYDFRKQTALFRKFPEALQGMARPKITWPFLKYGAVKSAAFFFLTAAGLAVIYYAFAFRRTSVEKRLLERFLRRMARHGYLRKQSEGLEEFVSKIADEDLQERASAFVKEFEGHYYKDRVLSKETLSALVQTIRRL